MSRSWVLLDIMFLIVLIFACETNTPKAITINDNSPKTKTMVEDSTRTKTIIEDSNTKSIAANKIRFIKIYEYGYKSEFIYKQPKTKTGWGAKFKDLRLKKRYPNGSPTEERLFIEKEKPKKIKVLDTSKRFLREINEFDTAGNLIKTANFLRGKLQLLRGYYDYNEYKFGKPTDKYKYYPKGSNVERIISKERLKRNFVELIPFNVNSNQETKTLYNYDENGFTVKIVKIGANGQPKSYKTVIREKFTVYD